MVKNDGFKLQNCKIGIRSVSNMQRPQSRKNEMTAKLGGVWGQKQKKTGAIEK